MKKLTSVLVVLLVLVLFVSCSTQASLSSYSVKGLTISLDSSFVRSDVSGYTACYTSLFSTVYMLREEFTLFDSPEDMTVLDYAEMVLANNDMSDTASVEQNEEKGYATFFFTQRENERKVSYFVSLYKGSDAFWTVQFVCPSAQYESMKDSFVTWASSVTFSETQDA